MLLNLITILISLPGEFYICFAAYSSRQQYLSFWTIYKVSVSCRWSHHKTQWSSRWLRICLGTHTTQWRMQGWIGCLPPPPPSHLPFPDIHSDILDLSSAYRPVDYIPIQPPPLCFSRSATTTMVQPCAGWEWSWFSITVNLLYHWLQIMNSISGFLFLDLTDPIPRIFKRCLKIIIQTSSPRCFLLCRITLAML